MKKNDTVKYLGCTKEQILWRNNDDPRNLLFIGVKYNTSCMKAMDQNLNWNLLHQFAKELGQEGHDYKIHKRSLSDKVSTHKEIVIEYGYKQEEQ